MDYLSRNTYGNVNHKTVNIYIIFYVLLTVHLSIFILQISQLDAQSFVLQ